MIIDTLTTVFLYPIAYVIPIAPYFETTILGFNLGSNCRYRIVEAIVDISFADSLENLGKYPKCYLSFIPYIAFNGFHVSGQTINH